MDDLTKRALESVLFFDDATPIEELIARYAHEPLHLDAPCSEALVGPGKLFSLWPDGADAWALLAADLHSFVRDAGLPDENLILRLPASFDGTPLTRITADAFRSWLSYGTSIRLLILPEGMTETSNESLSPLCFEHCFIPSTLQRFGTHHVRWNKMTCYPKEIRYTVSEESRALSAADGSLLNKDGARLIAQAYPYGNVAHVAAGVSDIRSDAFMHTPTPPHCIVCPDSLRHVDDIVDEHAVWACDLSGELAQHLRSLGGYTASTEVRETNGALYDIRPHASEGGNGCAPCDTPCEREAACQAKDAYEASLTVCRPETTELSLLESLDGAPLARIGRRAIRSHIPSLAMPCSMREIESGNTCPGLEKLVLNEGLERIGAQCFTTLQCTNPVRIPRSVQAIGRGAFAGSFVHFDAVQTTVLIPGFTHELFTARSYRYDEEKRQFVCERSSNLPAFDAEKPESVVAPFDMNAYDELLCSKRMIRMKKEAIAWRLEGAAALSHERERLLGEQLKSDAAFAIEFAADSGNARRMVERLAHAGFYDDDRFNAQCDALRAHRKNEALSVLMAWKATQSKPKPARPSARFAF